MNDLVSGGDEQSAAEDERERLLQSLGREYDLVAKTVTLGDSPFTLHAIADPDALLDDDRLLEASHDELPWHPYWVHAGAAANGLADLIARTPLNDLSVLDLGCGLGLTALAAAASGAAVVACDHAPPALDFTRLNTLPFADRVAVRRFDWRFDAFDVTFDLIVGSDVLYNRADLPHLDRLWRKALAEGGAILLGDPRRPLTSDLLRELEPLGWRTLTQEVKTIEGPARITVVARGELDRKWGRFSTGQS